MTVIDNHGVDFGQENRFPMPLYVTDATGMTFHLRHDHMIVAAQVPASAPLPTPHDVRCVKGRMVKIVRAKVTTHIAAFENVDYEEE